MRPLAEPRMGPFASTPPLGTLDLACYRLGAVVEQDQIPPGWTRDLESKLLGRLREEWRQINWCYFSGTLRAPVFRIVDAGSFLARWDAATRHIEFARPTLLVAPWPRLMEVLKHETAHQFVSEMLAVDEDPHGPAFRATCERIGISGGATMSTELSDEDMSGDDARIVARIRKLLALAESPELHEAEAAATAARKLMLRHNLKASELSARDRNLAPNDRFSVRFLGRPTGRVQEHERRLASILSDYFFVEVIWIGVWRPLEGKRGSMIEVSGTPANLAMAEFVYDFLLETAERLWKAHKRREGITKNRDRLSYLAGVMKGFSDKLESEDSKLAGEGLVWVPNAGLHDFYRARHPYVRSVRSGGRSRNAAFAEGSDAGSTIVLSRPIESESTRREPRALPPARRSR